MCRELRNLFGEKLMVAISHDLNNSKQQNQPAWPGKSVTARETFWARPSYLPGLPQFWHFFWKLVGNFFCFFWPGGSPPVACYCTQPFENKYRFFPSALPLLHRSQLCGENSWGGILSDEASDECVGDDHLHLHRPCSHAATSSCRKRKVLPWCSLRQDRGLHIRPSQCTAQTGYWFVYYETRVLVVNHFLSCHLHTTETSEWQKEIHSPDVNSRRVPARNGYGIW